MLGSEKPVALLQPFFPVSYLSCCSCLCCCHTCPERNLLKFNMEACLHTNHIYLLYGLSWSRLSCLQTFVLTKKMLAGVKYYSSSFSFNNSWTTLFLQYSTKMFAKDYKNCSKPCALYQIQLGYSSICQSCT